MYLHQLSLYKIQFLCCLPGFKAAALRIQTFSFGFVFHRLPTIGRGYAVVTDEDGAVITQVTSVTKDTTVKTYVSDGAFTATIKTISPGEAIAQELPDEKV